MNLAEIVLLVVAVVLPLALGVAAALARKPWRWAAAVVAVLATVAMIAPEPEAGESRMAWGDLPFVLVVVLFVAGLTWLSHFLARRLWVRRHSPRRAATHQP